jgi:hypothetical protein
MSTNDLSSLPEPSPKPNADVGPNCALATGSASVDEYLRRNLVVCKAVGLKAEIKVTTQRLRGMSRVPKWLFASLTAMHERAADLPPELAKWRDESPDNPFSQNDVLRMARENAALKEHTHKLAEQLAECAGVLASVDTDRRFRDMHGNLWISQTLDWCKGAKAIGEKANELLEAHDDLSEPNKPDSATEGRSPEVAL